MFKFDDSATVFFPSHLHWTSEELAEAVPLRLHQLFAFDASGVLGSANAPPLPSFQARSGEYLPLMPEANVFRVR